MDNIVSRVTNARVYLDGSTLAGIASEVDLPTFTFNQATHSALAMIGELETFVNLAAMESRIKWEGIDKTISKKLYNPFYTADIQVRSYSEDYEGALTPVITEIVNYLKGRVKQQDPGKFTTGSAVDTETMFSVQYFKQVIDGETIVEVDIKNNIFIVDGVDLMAERNRALGG